MELLVCCFQCLWRGWPLAVLQWFRQFIPFSVLSFTRSVRLGGQLNLCQLIKHNLSGIWRVVFLLLQSSFLKCFSFYGPNQCLLSRLKVEGFSFQISLPEGLPLAKHSVAVNFWPLLLSFISFSLNVPYSLLSFCFSAFVFDFVSPFQELLPRLPREAHWKPLYIAESATA